MALDKQIQVYSIDTKSFYNEKEEEINKLLLENKIIKRSIEEYILIQILKEKDIKLKNKLSEIQSVEELIKLKEKNKYVKRYIKQLKKDYKIIIKAKNYKNKLNDDDIYIDYKEKVQDLNKKLNQLLKENTQIRKLNPNKISKYNIVSIFESSTSRTLKHQINQLTEDLFIIRILHYSVLEQLIENGFIYNNEKYITLTASAGQIRNKKIVFIKENKWNECKNTLMCGLTIEDINNSSEKGCNINKFLAYLALNNSATDEWKDFDIDKAIVIPDYETNVLGEVDFIHNELFTVIRKLMEVPIPHSDGCGWILSSEANKNFMVRMPWFKGLLTPVDFIRFCEEYNDKNYKITDIYGKEWDLKKDNIKYVFSKSQFKMWKYYPNLYNKDNELIQYGWDTYKNNFKKYHCQACKCNVEPDTKDFTKASFNYQMWQTLIDISDKEIEKFTKPIKKYITNAYTDRDTMLDILGVSDRNKKRDHFQEALRIYPELLKDSYCKDILSSVINSRKKEAKYGKFKINATYTFLIPDVFAWMEYSIKGDKNPKGLLKEGNQVSCKLFKKENKLLVDRSPHLYREHAVRNNIVNKETKKWFITDGIYTSCHDLISKILQFDNDGDKALVIADKTIISISERNMQGIVPLYYEMGKAKPKIINNYNIYESLINAFKYGNIGKYSNQLTSMWNSDEPDLEVIKIITALNNFSIDAAKTLKMPSPPKEVTDKIKKANRKLPYFFQFAKDKDKTTLEKRNNSTVNRICKQIEDIKQKDFEFKNLGRFKYALLMNNSKIEIDDNVIKEYQRLNEEMQKYFFKNESSEKEEVATAVWTRISMEFNNFCNKNDIQYSNAVDMIIKYIYKSHRDCKKNLLFKVFGETILNNLQKNIKSSLDDGYKICKECGKRFKKKSNKQVYCDKCSKEIERIKNKERKQKQRRKNVTA